MPAAVEADSPPGSGTDSARGQRRSAKKVVSSSAHSSAATSIRTSNSWLRRGSDQRRPTQKWSEKRQPLALAGTRRAPPRTRRQTARTTRFPGPKNHKTHPAQKNSDLQNCASILHLHQTLCTTLISESSNCIPGRTNCSTSSTNRPTHHTNAISHCGTSIEFPVT